MNLKNNKPQHNKDSTRHPFPRLLRHTLQPVSKGLTPFPPTRPPVCPLCCATAHRTTPLRSSSSTTVRGTLQAILVKQIFWNAVLRRCQNTVAHSYLEQAAIRVLGVRGIPRLAARSKVTEPRVRLSRPSASAQRRC